MSRRTFRSLGAPGLLLLTLSGAQLGCGLSADEQRRQAEEAASRAEARRHEEVDPPSPAVLEQLRQTAQDFLTEHNTEITVQGFSFTELTPNLFIIGATVIDKVQGNSYVKQLTAERLRDSDWGEDGEVKESGDTLWVIDHLDEVKMRALAQRHGIGNEVDSVSSLNPHPYGSSHFLENYLIWRMIFHRPSPMGYWYGRPGFSPLAPGFRPDAPNQPLRPEDARPYQAAAAATGGRSSVFLNGAAWNPPRSVDVPNMTGQAYGISRAGGFVMGKTGLGGVARGGFGATGRAVSGHIGGHAGS
jgi:hypothetical protein